MSRLIIVAGAGGAGKSFFLRLWEKNDKNAIRIKKYVSEERSPREIEIRTGESDLIFHQKYNIKTGSGKKWYTTNYPDLKPSTKLEFHNRQYGLECLKDKSGETYIYDYHGTYYEVDTPAIDVALSRGKTPIVIVRKCETIKRMLKKYQNALVIYVQCVLSGNDLVNKLISLGESETDAKRRESRNNEDFLDYIEGIQSLSANPRVVLNNFDEEQSGTLFKQIADIYKDEIANYNFKEKSVFVIQSFKDAKDSKENYKIIEQATKNSLGMEAKIKRADLRQDGSYNIPDHVWKSIEDSDCIICDISHDRCNNCTEIENGTSLSRYQGVSPNVWIELGFTIARHRVRNLEFGERLVLVCREDDKSKVNATIPPIDVGNTFNYIKYSSQVDLMEKLEMSLTNMFNK